MPQFNLPVLTHAQIDQLEDFVKSLQNPLFRKKHQPAIIQKYVALVTEISFESFWQGLESANIPHARPEDFEKLPVWEGQIMWIFQFGLPTAWSLIPQLREVAQSEEV